MAVSHYSVSLTLESSIHHDRDMILGDRLLL